MWQHYRRTFIPTQILMIVICIALMAVWKVPGKAIVIYLLIMEVFGVIGALWAANMRRRILRSQGSLPDDRR
jgi:hypothetical protein